MNGAMARQSEGGGGGGAHTVALATPGGSARTLRGAESRIPTLNPRARYTPVKPQSPAFELARGTSGDYSYSFSTKRAS